MKILKIMADYQCSPLWIEGDGLSFYNLDIAESGFSDNIKSRLSAWAAIFDQTLDPDYPPDSKFKNSKEEDKFEKEGYSIWLDIYENYHLLFDEIVYHSFSSGRTFSNPDEYKQAGKSM